MISLTACVIHENLISYTLQRKNSASKRTALYIKKLCSSNFTSKEENSEDDEDETNNTSENPDFLLVSLDLEKSPGIYLMSYANIMRNQMISKDSKFQIFDES